MKTITIEEAKELGLNYFEVYLDQWYLNPLDGINDIHFEKDEKGNTPYFGLVELIKDDEAGEIIKSEYQIVNPHCLGMRKLKDILERIGAFEFINRCDHKCDNNHPYCKEIFENASYIVNSIPYHFIQSLDLEDVTCGQIGTITIDWNSPNLENSLLSLEIGSKYMNFFIDGLSTSNYSMEKLPVNDPESIKHIVKALELIYNHE